MFFLYICNLLIAHWENFLSLDSRLGDLSFPFSNHMQVPVTYLTWCHWFLILTTQFLFVVLRFRVLIYVVFHQIALGVATLMLIVTNFKFCELVDIKFIGYLQLPVGHVWYLTTEQQSRWYQFPSFSKRYPWRLNLFIMVICVCFFLIIYNSMLFLYAITVVLLNFQICTFSLNFTRVANFFFCAYFYAYWSVPATLPFNSFMKYCT